VAKGVVATSNYLQMASQGLKILGLLAAIPFGLEGACWGLLSANIAGAFLTHRLLNKHIGFTFAHLLAACTTSGALTLIVFATALLPHLAANTLELGRNATSLISTALAATVWLAYLVKTKHNILNMAISTLQRRRGK